jgi:DNA-binding CsgD family transcriptional regulator
MAEHPPVELSERELEILKLLATGASNKEIAQQLYISTNTVKVHLRNIFTKIEVTSRTEAAMYAVRLGLVRATDTDLSRLQEHRDQPVVDTLPGNMMPFEELAQDSNPVGVNTFFHKQKLKGFLASWRGVVALVILVGIFGMGLFWYQRIRSTTTKPDNSGTSPLIPTFSEMAPLPMARKGLAVTAYNNRIYAIGGTSSQGITGINESFDPSTNRWRDEASKPTPVTDINAVVIGGVIYIPGGRLSSGKPTNVFEVYDPGQKRWETRAALPIPISGYALIAYEGRLYLFGGWDGQNYLATVYEYDPEKNSWRTLTPMPSPRAFAGAAIAGGGIYIIGGYDGAHALAENLRFDPDQEKAGLIPWQNVQPLPQPRYAMGVISVVDVIQVIGGKTDTTSTTPLQTMQYNHLQDTWQSINSLFPDHWVEMGLASLGTQYFAMGGEVNGQLSAKNYAYQTVYIIVIPVIK